MPTLQEICDAIGGELQGDGTVEIEGVNSLESAGASELAPLEDEKFVRAAQDSGAGAIAVTRELADQIEGNRIVHDFPMVAMNGFIESLGQARQRPPAGIHETAVVDPSATVPASASIGPNVVIGANVRMGERCIVHPNVTIEYGVTLGDDCVLDPGCVLHEGAQLGSRVVIGTNAVISRQGFGFARGPKGPVHIHHVGVVTIGDDSHIGACCSIDRARYTVTSVGTMSGLDYGIHLGHNASVGDRSYLAAQSGMAGHSFVGNDCEIGGQCGFANNSGVRDRCRVGAKSGLLNDYGSDKDLFGRIAVDMKLSLRMHAALKKLAQGKKR
ncbi:MAG: UDP-3-O-(3-hydroxymyristoyl)glucosamine N-acyltransferase [Planctomycetota bacterium]|jgi:UDP-3-O-[3-hydroxymyristoyl] glucosamine N-acyltransferase